MKAEHGLTHSDRVAEIIRKFGADRVPEVLDSLEAVETPSENVLGAIVFLANRAHEIPGLVELANSDRNALLVAATVKEERG